MSRSAIPNWGQEYPEYEYKAWPKYVGMTDEGEALIAKDKDEFHELKELAVYPKVLGKDKDGNDVVAQTPRDEQWLKASVAKPSEDPAVAAKREADRIAAEEEVKRKAEAYDKMMAEKEAADKAAAEKAAAEAKAAKAAEAKAAKEKAS